MVDAGFARRRPTGPTVVVTTDDETVLHCTPREISGAAPRQARWVLVESSGTEHIGPQYLGFTSMSDVARMVSDWWKARKERDETPVP
jgi:hypothetical protein